VSRYDVIIVGAGPAGIFTALELKEKAPHAKVLILEAGKPIDERGKRDVITGRGGAGAFSDGKLNLSPHIGGRLLDYVPESELEKLIDYVHKTYIRFGAGEFKPRLDPEKVAELEYKAIRAGMKLVPYEVHHMGTEVTREVSKNMYLYLKDRADIRFHTRVTKILVEDGKAVGVETKNGERFYGDFVVVAPGRFGASRLVKEAKRIGIKTVPNPVDIGVRVEIPRHIMRHLTDVLYEPKLIYTTKTYDDRVRTFCVNPQGFVTKEYYDDVVTVNGHAYRYKKSKNTNFAILVSSRFTEPFNQPVEYAKHIARLANMLAGGSVLIQRLIDLLAGRRSTEVRISRSTIEPTLKEAVPGDLAYVLPHRHLTDIVEFLEAMEGLVPGILGNGTLLYGVEIKLYSARVDVKNTLETKAVERLYTIGDGSGITRSLMQASVSGVIAARDIASRIRVFVKNHNPSSSS